MDAFYQWLNTLVNKNKSEFAEWAEINWLNPYLSNEFQIQRDNLLSKIDSVLFKDTKPYHKQISKGCNICGSGKWSCLFITNKCNANCFYCPAPQKEDELPSTQGIDFENAEDYANYVRFFDFKGVSFSGGEPLLYFDRTVNYLQTVKKVCNNDVYTWMYTNGLLIDKVELYKLASAGLDEMRFDIGATNYSLDKIKYAKDIIPNITIEIPAIPEEKNKLIEMLPKIAKAGVTNLNLHQLRLTKHNVKNIVNRGYTIINAERPIVLESELAALEIINYAKENNIDIGINYCSFYFKHRFQKAGFRKQIASKLSSSDAFITQNGFIREQNDSSIAYKTIRLFQENPLQKDIKTLEINAKQYYYSENFLTKKTVLSQNEINSINKLIEKEPIEVPIDAFLFNIWQLEYIEKGLRNY